MNTIISLVIGGILIATVPFIGSKISTDQSKEEVSAQQTTKADQKKVAEYKIQSGDTFTSNQQPCGRKTAGLLIYFRGYISHLFKAKEISALSLLTIHNLYFFNNFVARIREEIKKGRI